jgi:ubiquinone/menaquinone biosynthesis C-methylase UbiE
MYKKINKKMALKIMLEPIRLFYGMNSYRKTFNLSSGETLVSFFKCTYFLWHSFPILVPLYVFWPSSLEIFKNKFDFRKIMSFYNSPFYWSHLIPHEFSVAKQKYVKHILDLIVEFNKSQNIHIIEAGCGVGSYTTHLSKIGEVTALDISQPSLRLIRFRIGKKVNTIMSSAEALPFCSANFELAICMDVLEHIADPKNVVTALMNTLNRENGILIANYDIDTREKDHIGKPTQQEFEKFLTRNFCITKEVKFEIGSSVYIIMNQKS